MMLTIWSWFRPHKLKDMVHNQTACTSDGSCKQDPGLPTLPSNWKVPMTALRFRNQSNSQNHPGKHHIYGYIFIIQVTNQDQPNDETEGGLEWSQIQSSVPSFHEIGVHHPPSTLVFVKQETAEIWYLEVFLGDSFPQA